MSIHLQCIYKSVPDELSHLRVDDRSERKSLDRRGFSCDFLLFHRIDIDSTSRSGHRQVAGMAHSSGAPAPASAASPALDLASLPSIPLSADMVAHLLQNIQDGGSEHTGRVTRSKGRSSQSNSTSSAPPPPLPPWISSTSQAQVQDANIYATPTRADSKQPQRESHQQHHNEDSTLKNASAADDDSQREAASGAARRTCAHCGREFKRASDCRRHERIHTNDK